MLMEFPSTCHLLLMQGSFLLAPPTRFFFLNAAPIRVSNKSCPNETSQQKHLLVRARVHNGNPTLARVEITQIVQILGWLSWAVSLSGNRRLGQFCSGGWGGAPTLTNKGQGFVHGGGRRAGGNPEA